MAKKQRPKPKSTDEPRDALIAVRCKPSFKTWLEGFAKAERSTPSQLVELGLVALAKARNFETPPER